MSAFTDKQEFHLTEARLSSPPSEILLEHYGVPGLARERRRFAEFMLVDLAHTVMLAEQGIIPIEAARAIVRELSELSEKGEAALAIDPRKGSFLLQVESHLRKRVGEHIAGQMHVGRSRIDQGATVRRLFKRNLALDVFASLLAMRRSVLALAQRHARTIMPGYTHMQQAQPWVFGHYLLSFSSRLEESFDRIAEAYRRVNRNPLGTVGLAGTSWPLDRRRTTEFLGFHDIVDNSKLGREAFYAAELVAALSFVMSDLNDLASDFHLWSTTEFNFVETHDAYCGTSSIFPQKKNPVGLETVKKASGGAVTWLATALATFRAEGTGDQAVRELPMAEEALRTTASMLDLMTGMVTTLIVHEERMHSAVRASWATASNLADEIVQQTGLSFREVHHVVGRLVRNSISAGRAPGDVTGADLARAAMETIGQSIELPDGFISHALDPQHFVNSRVTTGSVAPAEVDRLLLVAGQRIEAHEQWLAEERRRIAAGCDMLASAARLILERQA
jgi:argininosuccinate lyase